jgi:energy-coupling factor transport system permease protein
MYGLLDTSAPFPFGLPGLVAGLVLVVAGVAAAGRRTRRTRYRPDAWRWPEWAVVATGVAAVVAVGLGAAADPAALAPSVVPLEWPAFAAIPTFGVLVAALPSVLAPTPPLRAASSEHAAPPANASEVART